MRLPRPSPRARKSPAARPKNPRVIPQPSPRIHLRSKHLIQNLREQRPLEPDPSSVNPAVNAVTAATSTDPAQPPPQQQPSGQQPVAQAPIATPPQDPAPANAEPGRAPASPKGLTPGGIAAEINGEGLGGLSDIWNNYRTTIMTLAGIALLGGGGFSFWKKRQEIM